MARAIGGGLGLHISLLWVVLLLGCGSGSERPDGRRELGRFVQPERALSAIRYHDRDLVSLNEQCPVAGDRLATSIEPLYVNGRPIGFC